MGNTFNSAAIDAKYRMLQGDPVVETGNFKGKLSEVTDPAILDAMIKRKSNLVELKTAEKPATTAQRAGQGSAGTASGN